MEKGKGARDRKEKIPSSLDVIFRHLSVLPGIRHTDKQRHPKVLENDSVMVFDVSCKLTLPTSVSVSHITPTN